MLETSPLINGVLFKILAADGALILCGCNGGETVAPALSILPPTTFLTTGWTFFAATGVLTADIEDVDVLHKEYVSKLLPWVTAGSPEADGAAVVDAEDDELEDVTEEDGDECTLLFVLFLAWRGEECGLCFSVRDKVLLNACSDEVAILKSPRS